MIVRKFPNNMYFIYMIVHLVSLKKNKYPKSFKAFPNVSASLVHCITVITTM